MWRRMLGLAVATVVIGASVAQAGGARGPAVADLVGGSSGWTDYFPFRLGDSWTYDWKTSGPMATGGAQVRTRAFDGTSFLSDSIGYKLVSDDGSFHLYTFEDGVLAIHSSLEAGRYFDYDPPVVIAAPDLRTGEPRVLEQPGSQRRWTTTLLGVQPLSVPLGTFERAIAIQVEMQGKDYASVATHYFAPRVGLIAYKYTLRDAAKNRELLHVDAQLRLARLAGVNITSLGDLVRVSSKTSVPNDDRGLRDQLRSALEKRYTWSAEFPGFKGDVELRETGKPTVKGSFVINADLSVKVDAPDDASRSALRNEISSFVTHRKPTDFDLTYAETTFVRKATRPDGGIVVQAAGDPLQTTYTIQNGEIVEMGRSMGRVSYTARERDKLRTEDGRLITVEYDVAYSSNEKDAMLSTERTRDTYTRLGQYWVPQARRVERVEGGKDTVTRELVLSGLKAQ